MIRVAYSFDDAPRMAASGGVRASERCMDRVREVLVAHAIRDCIAFVIGAEAEADRGPLERWLAAGFELGNHAWSHRPASELGVEELLKEAERCDRLLAELGAKRRFFRFPRLDAGADRGSRERIAAGLRGLGYRVAPGSLDVFDHAFEARLRGGDPAAAERRWLWVAERALCFEDRRLRREEGRAVPHLHYGHFCALAERALDAMLARFAARGVVPVGIVEALGDPLYRRYEEASGTGRVAPFLLRKTLPERIVSRLARLRPGHWPHVE